MKLIQAATQSRSSPSLLRILGVTVINAKPSKQAATAPASNAIDVMRMMIDAKDLPIEQFDAY